MDLFRLAGRPGILRDQLLADLAGLGSEDDFDTWTLDAWPRANVLTPAADGDEVRQAFQDRLTRLQSTLDADLGRSGRGKTHAQLQHNMWVTASRTAVLSIITGGGKWVEMTIPADRLYQHLLLTAEKKFWCCVETGEAPQLFGIEPPRLGLRRSEQWIWAAPMHGRNLPACFVGRAPRILNTMRQNPS
jgi:hypothetical protein